MQLSTIVEEYIAAAMRQAVAETLEDGTVGAYVPTIPGLVAFGADNHECARNLYAQLEEWVRAGAARDQTFPVIDGIDLNTCMERIQTTYGDGWKPSPASQIFEDESALEDAFAQRDKMPESKVHGSS